MGPMNFTEEDKTQFIAFLNSVAKNAMFTLNTSDLIGHFKLLAHMQQQILPKIDANILEIKRVIEAQPPQPPAPPSETQKTE